MKTPRYEKRLERLLEMYRIERRWLLERLSLEDMEIFNLLAEKNSEILYEQNMRDDLEYRIN